MCSARLPTAFGSSSNVNRPITAGRDVQTPMNLTNQFRQVTGTRSGSRISSMGPIQGVTLPTSVTVVDRPITQHGLGGLKTGIRPSQRHVQDKTYFLGLLRTKLGEINVEMTSLSRECELLKHEQTSLRSYDKRATELALVLKSLQEELGDYNMLVDKLSTDTETESVKWECTQLRQHNEEETKVVEELFTDRRSKEHRIALLEKEVEEEKNVADSLVANMGKELQANYATLKAQAAVLKGEIEAMQSEIDALDDKKAIIEKGLLTSQLKQEAVSLLEKQLELIDKRTALLDEEKTRGTPVQEREKLLKQVKEDNQEITMMERLIQEVKEQSNTLNIELHHLNEDIDSSQSERNQQYFELRNREQMMDQFMESYDDNKKVDMERKVSVEHSIVSLLNVTSHDLDQFCHLPSITDLSSLKEDLIFKEKELEKSKLTATSVIHEQEHLIASLGKVNQLDDKIKQEMASLKEKMMHMENELIMFQNIDELKMSSHDKERKMSKQSTLLTVRRNELKEIVSQLERDYDTLQKQLHENETFIQLSNLERKWQHLEQNNFTLKEFAENKKAETNYLLISKSVAKQLNEYNRLLNFMLSKS